MSTQAEIDKMSEEERINYIYSWVKSGSHTIKEIGEVYEKFNFTTEQEHNNHFLWTLSNLTNPLGVGEL